MNEEIKFKQGDKVWIYHQFPNKIIQVTIDNILVDKGGWCYEYSYDSKLIYPFLNGKTYSGGKEVFATKEEVIDYYGLKDSE